MSDEKSIVGANRTSAAAKAPTAEENTVNAVSLESSMSWQALSKARTPHVKALQPRVHWQRADTKRIRPQRGPESYCPSQRRKESIHTQPLARIDSKIESRQSYTQLLYPHVKLSITAGFLRINAGSSHLQRASSSSCSKTSQICKRNLRKHSPVNSFYARAVTAASLAVRPARHRPTETVTQAGGRRLGDHNLPVSRDPETDSVAGR